MRLARIISVLEYLAGLLVGVALMIVTLGASLLAEWETVRVLGLTVRASIGVGAANGVTIAAAALACAVMAVAATRLREAVAIRIVRSDPIASVPWSQAAGAARAYGLGRAVVEVVLAIGLLLLGVLAFGGLVGENPVALSPRVGAVLLLYAITGWLLIGPPPAVSAAGRAAERFLRRGQPRYAITPEGVAVDLRLRRPEQATTGPVLLRFDELAEVRPLSYVGARAFLRYEVGPNLDLAARQTEDVAHYLRGDIARPGVYTIGTPTMAGRHVLLRGPELFYLLAVDADDVTDAIDAFEAHGAGRA